MAQASLGRGPRDGPKAPRSTVLNDAKKTIVVAFRRHKLLPLDDCLWSLQATLQHLPRSSPYRCFKRHGNSCLPEVDGDKPATKVFGIGAFGTADLISEGRISGSS